ARRCRWRSHLCRRGCRRSRRPNRSISSSSSLRFAPAAPGPASFKWARDKAIASRSWHAMGVPEDAMTQYEVTQTPTPTKWAFIPLFWLWGGGFGIFAIASMIQAEGLSGLTVVTTTAVTMRLVAWVGGLLLFGVAAIAAPSKITVTVVDAQGGGTYAAPR